MKSKIARTWMVSIFAIVLTVGMVLPAHADDTPTVSLSPTQFVWWLHPPYCGGAQGIVTLTNDGPGVLDISGIATNSGVFSQTNTCGSTLGVGESCSITVTWRGVVTGGASLVVTDDGVGSPQTVPLIGICASIK